MPRRSWFLLLRCGGDPGHGSCVLLLQCRADHGYFFSFLPLHDIPPLEFVGPFHYILYFPHTIATTLLWNLFVRFWGLLHVSNSAYELPYDSVHDFHTSCDKITLWTLKTFYRTVNSCNEPVKVFFLGCFEISNVAHLFPLFEVNSLYMAR
jgi:hypothetical protein